MAARPTEVSVFLRGRLVQQHCLPPGEYVIGSDAGAHLCVASEQLAPRHAMLSLNSGEWVIEPLGARDATFVNGERISEARLIFPGQKARMGDVTLELRARKSAGGKPEELDPQAAIVRQLLPEEILGDRKYEIGPLVGSGGMGLILDAHEPAVQRSVAMKLMLNRARPVDIRRFVQEAQITARLEHPNIVPVHELGVNELDQPYYTMKYVRGISLAKVIHLLQEGDPETLQKFTLNSLLVIFQKACDAVAFAHSRGIIHRDLKPDNIMVGEYGEVLVLDWGLAKVLGTEPESIPPAQAEPQPLDGYDTTSTVTQVGAILGTLQYMPPEQARGETTNVDEWSDIYSLGAVLYQMLALRVPFAGENTADILENVRAGRLAMSLEDASGLSHLPGGRVPKSLAAVVAKAMAADPAQRYASVKELQAEIAAYQSGFATSAEHAGLWKLLGLFLRRHRTVSIAAACLLFAGILFTVHAVHQRDLAEKARRIATAQRDAAEERLYVSHMLQVGRHLTEGRPASAGDLLERHLREPSGRDLRGWEWYFRTALRNQDVLRVTAHPAGAFALGASADGSRLATGGTDGEIAVWQARGLVAQFRIPAHRGTVFAVAWHEGGKMIASGGADGMARIWDATTGKKLAEVLAGSGQEVRTLAWETRDRGRPRLAIGGLESDVFLWTPFASEGSEALEKIATTPHGVASLHWSTDGTRLALGARETGRCIQVIDIASKAGVLTAAAPTGGTDVFAVALDPAGRHIAAGTKNLGVAVIEIASNRSVMAEEIHRGFVSALAWSPDGKTLASASQDGTIRLSLPFAGARSERRVLIGHDGTVNALAWVRPPGASGAALPAGILFSAGADGTLRAWSPDGAGNAHFEPEEANWISAARWSPDGRRIAMASFRSHVYVVDPGSGASLPYCSSPGHVFDVAWSPAGDRIATASRDAGCVEIIDLATARSGGILRLPDVQRVAWSRSGKYLAGAGFGGARIWDSQTGAVLAEIPRPIGSVAWHADEQRLAVGGSDGSIDIWDLAAKKTTAQWRRAPVIPIGAVNSSREPPRQVFDLAWSPDGGSLAYVTQDVSAGLLDAHDGRQGPVFSGHGSGIWRLAWSPDGARIATCGQDGMVLVFNARTGDQVAQITHGIGNREVNAVDWSPDGRMLLSGGYDRSVRVWSTLRGERLAEVGPLDRFVNGHPGDVASIRKLAEKYAALGWVGNARDAFARARKAAPADGAVSVAAEEAEMRFSNAMEESLHAVEMPAATPEIAPRAVELLSTIHSAWEAGRPEEAVAAYRDLRTEPGAEKLREIARTYFSRAKWNVVWFPASADPLKDAATWRAQAGSGDALATTARSLCFPYLHRSPREMVTSRDVIVGGPGAEGFGMIARARISLPSGKWRFSTVTDCGVRVLVNDVPVIEHTGGIPAVEKSGDHEQKEDGAAEVVVEQFAEKGSAGLQFLIEPVVE